MSESNHEKDSSSVKSAETSTDAIIPEGKPKSGRVWKKKQTYRSSTQHRQGVLSHLCKSYEERKRIRDREKEVKAYERELREQTNKKKEAERLRREQLVFRRLENENKAAVYQEVNTFRLCYILTKAVAYFSYKILFTD